ncbi:J domain-containing protein [Candidatus Finniella inopinata]|uniref:J domain-containing protein n=1 Tax=Candidatus Finniella inopinata TaxID=1696036 RepID=A0A4Q7DIS0_9PROT|nr:J domain-containing protein [Candidatus Finniella inopinata]RZI46871.1 J domain-containing protein [Candidatus Finniella inopinata]
MLKKMIFSIGLFCVTADLAFSDFDNVSWSQEDYQTQRGLAVLLDEDPGLNGFGVLQNGFKAKDARSYFRDTKWNSGSDKLAGFLVHLVAQGKTPVLRELFDNPDWQVWAQLCSEMVIKADCMTIVSSLDAAKQHFQSSPSQLSRLAEQYINTALTKIFFGCWGISEEPTDLKTIETLKTIARNVGAKRSSSGLLLNQVLGSYDQYNSRLNPGNESLQQHFLIAAKEMTCTYTHDNSVAYFLTQEFINRGFKKDLINQNFNNLSYYSYYYNSYSSASPVGIMEIIIADSQFRKKMKNRSLAKSFSNFHALTNQDLVHLYELIVHSGFDLPQETYLLSTHIQPQFYYPSHSAFMKLWILFDNNLNHRASILSPEQLIQNGAQAPYPFQTIAWQNLAVSSKHMPTILRLMLLNQKKSGLQDASKKALRIINDSRNVSSQWSTYQSQTFENNFFQVMTLYDEICQISKPCTDADYVIHQPFLALCLEKAKFAAFNVKERLDVFGWLRGLRAGKDSRLRIQSFQKDVLAAIDSLVKSPGLTLPQKKQIQSWSTTVGLKIEFEELKKKPSAYKKPSLAERNKRRQPITITLENGGTFEEILPLLEKYEEMVKLNKEDLSNLKSDLALLDSEQSFEDTNEQQTQLIQQMRSLNDDIQYLELSIREALTKHKLITCSGIKITDYTGWKKIYRKISLKWHPDKNQDNKKEAEIKFGRVGHFHEYIEGKNPLSRR